MGMSKIMDDVSNLIQDDRLSLYQEDEHNLTIIEKPRKHYELTLKIIDKNAKAKKLKSVVLKRNYTYPKHMEEAILLDFLETMRNFVLEHKDSNTLEAWNSTFGKSWPRLLI